MRTGIASLLVLAAGLTPIGAAGTIYVHGTAGNDAWDGLCPTWNGGTCGPKRTIQAGINVAVVGDEVILAPVTYTGDGNRDIDFLGKAITVRGEDPNDPNVVAATVVDCQADPNDRHRGFNFITGEGRDSVLAGLSMINGCAPLVCWPDMLDTAGGGAILCRGTSPTIRSCVLTHNQACWGGGIASYGGCPDPYAGGSPFIARCVFHANSIVEWCGTGSALDCNGGAPVIEACELVENSGGGALGLAAATALITGCEFRGNASPAYNNAVRPDGGAILANLSSILVVNSKLSANSAGGRGGAIYGSGDGTVTLVGCEVSGNLAKYGGAFGAPYEPTAPVLSLINCTIVGNRAPSGPMLDWYSGDAILNNCINWNGPDWFGSGNCQITYSIVEGGWYGAGNLADDPLFAVPGYWDENGTPDYWDDDSWVNGDYRLRPGSPGIDAGNNDALPAGVTTDLAGNPRRADDPTTPDTGFGTPPIVDMGAYEYMPLGDVNCDGVINFDDINAFVLALSDPAAYAVAFPSCDRLKADCNGDGLVDFDDINAFVAVLSGT
jgi:predicted outer membrane repeat protein